MSPFRARRERLADDSLVVVRGGPLDRDELRADAERAFRRFGEHGVSILAAPTPEDVDVLAWTTLRRQEILTVTTAGPIRRARLELRPTFRRPHYTVMLPDLNADVDRLIACQNEAQPNPHYDRKGGGLMAVTIDIDVDWNIMDDTGLPWTFVDEAPDATKIVPGAFVLAGRGTAIAVAEVVDVGEDGVVHLRDVGGALEENLHRVRQGKPVT